MAERIGAKTITPGGADNVEVDRVCAGDNISHLLAGASAGTLAVTHMTGTPLIRAAGLMDVPAICLLNGVVADPEVVRMAARTGTVLMVSPVGMFETCGRLYQCLRGDGQEGV